MSNDRYEGTKKLAGKTTNGVEAGRKNNVPLHERSSTSQIKAQRADAAKRYPKDIGGAKMKYGESYGKAKK